MKCKELKGSCVLISTRLLWYTILYHSNIRPQHISVLFAVKGLNNCFKIVCLGEILVYLILKASAIKYLHLRVAHYCVVKYLNLLRSSVQFIYSALSYFKEKRYTNIYYYHVVIDIAIKRVYNFFKEIIRLQYMNKSFDVIDIASESVEDR